MIDHEGLVSKKKLKKTKEINLSDIEKNLEDGESQMYFLDVDLKRSTDRILVFRKYPF